MDFQDDLAAASVLGIFALGAASAITENENNRRRHTTAAYETLKSPVPLEQMDPAEVALQRRKDEYRRQTAGLLAVPFENPDASPALVSQAQLDAVAAEEAAVQARKDAYWAAQGRKPRPGYGPA